MNQPTVSWLAPGLIDGEAPAAPGSVVRLIASRCRTCDRYEFPARTSCPVCGDKSEAACLGTEATITGFTCVLYPAPGSLIATPYTVALATFPEGITILGLIRDMTFDELDVGGRVRTVAADIGGRIGYAYTSK